MKTKNDISKRKKIEAISKYMASKAYQDLPNKVFYVDFLFKSVIYEEVGDMPDSVKFANYFSW
jgi:hypothetical protein